MGLSVRTIYLCSKHIPSAPVASAQAALHAIRDQEETVETCLGDLGDVWVEGTGAQRIQALRGLGEALDGVCVDRVAVSLRQG